MCVQIKVLHWTSLAMYANRARSYFSYRIVSRIEQNSRDVWTYRVSASGRRNLCSEKSEPRFLSLATPTTVSDLVLADGAAVQAHLRLIGRTDFTGEASDSSACACVLARSKNRSLLIKKRGNFCCSLDCSVCS